MSDKEISDDHQSDDDESVDEVEGDLADSEQDTTHEYKHQESDALACEHNYSKAKEVADSIEHAHVKSFSKPEEVAPKSNPEVGTSSGYRELLSQEQRILKKERSEEMSDKEVSDDHEFGDRVKEDLADSEGDNTHEYKHLESNPLTREHDYYMKSLPKSKEVTSKSNLEIGASSGYRELPSQEQHSFRKEIKEKSDKEVLDDHQSGHEVRGDLADSEGDKTLEYKHPENPIIDSIVNAFMDFLSKSKEVTSKSNPEVGTSLGYRELPSQEQHILKKERREVSDKEVAADHQSDNQFVHEMREDLADSEQDNAHECKHLESEPLSKQIADFIEHAYVKSLSKPKAVTSKSNPEVGTSSGYRELPSQEQRIFQKEGREMSDKKVSDAHHSDDDIGDGVQGDFKHLESDPLTREHDYSKSLQNPKEVTSKSNPEVNTSSEYQELPSQEQRIFKEPEQPSKNESIEITDSSKTTDQITILKSKVTGPYDITREQQDEPLSSLDSEQNKVREDTRLDRKVLAEHAYSIINRIVDLVSEHSYTKPFPKSKENISLSDINAGAFSVHEEQLSQEQHTFKESTEFIENESATEIASSSNTTDQIPLFGHEYCDQRDITTTKQQKEPFVTTESERDQASEDKRVEGHEVIHEYASSVARRVIDLSSEHAHTKSSAHRQLPASGSKTIEQIDILNPGQRDISTGEEQEDSLMDTVQTKHKGIDIFNTKSQETGVGSHSKQEVEAKFTSDYNSLVKELVNYLSKAKSDIKTKVSTNLDPRKLLLREVSEFLHMHEGKKSTSNSGKDELDILSDEEVPFKAVDDTDVPSESKSQMIDTLVGLGESNSEVENTSEEGMQSSGYLTKDVVAVKYLREEVPPIGTENTEIPNESNAEPSDIIEENPSEERAKSSGDNFKALGERIASESVEEKHLLLQIKGDTIEVFDESRTKASCTQEEQTFDEHVEECGVVSNVEDETYLPSVDRTSTGEFDILPYEILPMIITENIEVSTENEFEMSGTLLEDESNTEMKSTSQGPMQSSVDLFKIGEEKIIEASGTVEGRYLRSKDPTSTEPSNILPLVEVPPMVSENIEDPSECKTGVSEAHAVLGQSNAKVERSSEEPEQSSGDLVKVVKESNTEMSSIVKEKHLCSEDATSTGEFEIFPDEGVSPLIAEATEVPNESKTRSKTSQFSKDIVEDKEDDQHTSQPRSINQISESGRSIIPTLNVNPEIEVLMPDFDDLIDDSQSAGKPSPSLSISPLDLDFENLLAENIDKFHEPTQFNEPVQAHEDILEEILQSDINTDTQSQDFDISKLLENLTSTGELLPEESSIVSELERDLEKERAKVSAVTESHEPGRVHESTQVYVPTQVHEPTIVVPPLGDDFSQQAQSTSSHSEHNISEQKIEEVCRKKSAVEKTKQTTQQTGSRKGKEWSEEKQAQSGTKQKLSQARNQNKKSEQDALRSISPSKADAGNSKQTITQPEAQVHKEKSVIKEPEQKTQRERTSKRKECTKEKQPQCGSEQKSLKESNPENETITMERLQNIIDVNYHEPMRARKLAGKQEPPPKITLPQLQQIRRDNIKTKQTFFHPHSRGRTRTGRLNTSPHKETPPMVAEGSKVPSESKIEMSSTVKVLGETNTKAERIPTEPTQSSGDLTKLVKEKIVETSTIGEEKYLRSDNLTSTGESDFLPTEEVPPMVEKSTEVPFDQELTLTDELKEALQVKEHNIETSDENQPEENTSTESQDGDNTEYEDVDVSKERTKVQEEVPNTSQSPFTNQMEESTETTTLDANPEIEILVPDFGALIDDSRSAGKPSPSFSVSTSDLDFERLLAENSTKVNSPTPGEILQPDVNTGAQSQDLEISKLLDDLASTDEPFPDLSSILSEFERDLNKDEANVDEQREAQQPSQDHVPELAIDAPSLGDDFLQQVQPTGSHSKHITSEQESKEVAKKKSPVKATKQRMQQTGTSTTIEQRFQQREPHLKDKSTVKSLKGRSSEGKSTVSEFRDPQTAPILVRRSTRYRPPTQLRKRMQVHTSAQESTQICVPAQVQEPTQIFAPIPLQREIQVHRPAQESTQVSIPTQGHGSIEIHRPTQLHGRTQMLRPTQVHTSKVLQEQKPVATQAFAPNTSTTIPQTMRIVISVPSELKEEYRLFPTGEVRLCKTGSTPKPQIKPDPKKPWRYSPPEDNDSDDNDEKQDPSSSDQRQITLQIITPSEQGEEKLAQISGSSDMPLSVDDISQQGQKSSKSHSENKKSQSKIENIRRKCAVVEKTEHRTQTETNKTTQQISPQKESKAKGKSKAKSLKGNSSKGKSTVPEFVEYPQSAARQEPSTQCDEERKVGADNKNSKNQRSRAGVSKAGPIKRKREEDTIVEKKSKHQKKEKRTEKHPVQTSNIEISEDMESSMSEYAQAAAEIERQLIDEDMSNIEIPEDVENSMSEDAQVAAEIERQLINADVFHLHSLNIDQEQEVASEELLENISDSPEDNPVALCSRQATEEEINLNPLSLPQEISDLSKELSAKPSKGSPQETSKESLKKSSKELPKESSNQSPKKSSEEASKELSKEHSKESSKKLSKGCPKDPSKESSKDLPSQSSNIDVTSEQEDLFEELREENSDSSKDKTDEQEHLDDEAVKEETTLNPLSLPQERASDIKILGRAQAMGETAQQSTSAENVPLQPSNIVVAPNEEDLLKELFGEYSDDADTPIATLYGEEATAEEIIHNPYLLSQERTELPKKSQQELLMKSSKDTTKISPKESSKKSLKESPAKFSKTSLKESSLASSKAGSSSFYKNLPKVVITPPERISQTGVPDHGTPESSFIQRSKKEETLQHIGLHSEDSHMQVTASNIEQTKTTITTVIPKSTKSESKQNEPQVPVGKIRHKLGKRKSKQPSTEVEAENKKLETQSSTPEESKDVPFKRKKEIKALSKHSKKVKCGKGIQSVKKNKAEDALKVAETEQQHTNTENVSLQPPNIVITPKLKGILKELFGDSSDSTEDVAVTAHGGQESSKKRSTGSSKDSSKKLDKGSSKKSWKGTPKKLFKESSKESSEESSKESSEESSKESSKESSTESSEESQKSRCEKKKLKVYLPKIVVSPTQQSAQIDMSGDRGPESLFSQETREEETLQYTSPQLCDEKIKHKPSKPKSKQSSEKSPYQKSPPKRSLSSPEQRMLACTNRYFSTQISGSQELQITPRQAISAKRSVATASMETEESEVRQGPYTVSEKMKHQLDKDKSKETSSRSHYQKIHPTISVPTQQESAFGTKGILASSTHEEDTQHSGRRFEYNVQQTVEPSRNQSRSPSPKSVGEEIDHEIDEDTLRKPPSSFVLKYSARRQSSAPQQYTQRASPTHSSQESSTTQESSENDSLQQLEVSSDQESQITTRQTLSVERRRRREEAEETSGSQSKSHSPKSSGEEVEHEVDEDTLRKPPSSLVCKDYARSRTSSSQQNVKISSPTHSSPESSITSDSEEDGLQKFEAGTDQEPHITTRQTVSMARRRRREEMEETSGSQSKSHSAKSSGEEVEHEIEEDTLRKPPSSFVCKGYAKRRKSSNIGESSGEDALQQFGDRTNQGSQPTPRQAESIERSTALTSVETEESDIRQSSYTTSGKKMKHKLGKDKLKEASSRSPYPKNPPKKYVQTQGGFEAPSTSEEGTEHFRPRLEYSAQQTEETSGSQPRPHSPKSASRRIEHVVDKDKVKESRTSSFSHICSPRSSSTPQQSTQRVPLIRSSQESSITGEISREGSLQQFGDRTSQELQTTPSQAVSLEKSTASLTHSGQESSITQESSEDDSLQQFEATTDQESQITTRQTLSVERRRRLEETPGSQSKSHSPKSSGEKVEHAVDEDTLRKPPSSLVCKDYARRRTSSSQQNVQIPSPTHSSPESSITSDSEEDRLQQFEAGTDQEPHITTRQTVSMARRRRRDEMEETSGSQSKSHSGKSSGEDVEHEVEEDTLRKPPSSFVCKGYAKRRKSSNIGESSGEDALQQFGDRTNQGSQPTPRQAESIERSTAPTSVETEESDVRQSSYTTSGKKIKHKLGKDKLKEASSRSPYPKNPPKKYVLTQGGFEAPSTSEEGTEHFRPRLEYSAQQIKETSGSQPKPRSPQSASGRIEHEVDKDEVKESLTSSFSHICSPTSSSTPQQSTQRVPLIRSSQESSITGEISREGSLQQFGDRTSQELQTTPRQAVSLEKSTASPTHSSQESSITQESSEDDGLQQFETSTDQGSQITTREIISVERSAAPTSVEPEESGVRQSSYTTSGKKIKYKLGKDKLKEASSISPYQKTPPKRYVLTRQRSAQIYSPEDVGVRDVVTERNIEYSVQQREETSENQSMRDSPKSASERVEHEVDKEKLSTSSLQQSTQRTSPTHSRESYVSQEASEETLQADTSDGKSQESDFRQNPPEQRGVDVDTDELSEEMTGNDNIPHSKTTSGGEGDYDWWMKMNEQFDFSDYRTKPIRRESISSFPAVPSTSRSTVDTTTPLEHENLPLIERQHAVEEHTDRVQTSSICPGTEEEHIPTSRQYSEDHFQQLETSTAQSKTKDSDDSDSINLQHSSECASENKSQKYSAHISTSDNQPKTRTLAQQQSSQICLPGESTTSTVQRYVAERTEAPTEQKLHTEDTSSSVIEIVEDIATTSLQKIVHDFQYDDTSEKRSASSYPLLRTCPFREAFENWSPGQDSDVQQKLLTEDTSSSVIEIVEDVVPTSLQKIVHDFQHDDTPEKRSASSYPLLRTYPFREALENWSPGQDSDVQQKLLTEDTSSSVRDIVDDIVPTSLQKSVHDFDNDDTPEKRSASSYPLLRTYPFREALENWSPGQDSDVQQKLLTEDTSSSVIEIVEDVVPTSLQKIVHDFDNDDTPEKRSASSYPLLRTYPSREALENWSPGQDSDVQQKLLTEDTSSSVIEIVEDVVPTSLQKIVHDFDNDDTPEKRSASSYPLLRTCPFREAFENWSPGQDSDVQQKLLTEDTSSSVREIVEDVVPTSLQKIVHDFDNDDTPEKRSASSYPLLRTYPSREALENWSPGQDSDVQQKLLTEDTSSSVIEIVEDVVPTSLQKIVHDFDNDDTPEKRSASSYPLLRTYPSREALENWSPGQDSDVQQKLLTEDTSSSVIEIVEDVVPTSLQKIVHDFDNDDTPEKRSASSYPLLRTYPFREALENWSPGQDSDVQQKLLTEDTSSSVIEIVEDVVPTSLQKIVHDFDNDDTPEKRSASSYPLLRTYPFREALENWSPGQDSDVQQKLLTEDTSSSVIEIVDDIVSTSLQKIVHDFDNDDTPEKRSASSYPLLRTYPSREALENWSPGQDSDVQQKLLTEDTSSSVIEIVEDVVPTSLQKIVHDFDNDDTPEKRSASSYPLLRTYPSREALENWSPGQDSDVQQKLLTEDTSSSVIEIVEGVVPTSLQKIVHDFYNDDTPEKRSASSYPLLRTCPFREAFENWSPGQDSDVQQKLLTEDTSSSVREIVEDVVPTSLQKIVHDFDNDDTPEKRSASSYPLLRTYPSREALENWSPGQDSDVQQKLLTEDTSSSVIEIVEDVVPTSLQKIVHDFYNDDTPEKRSASSYPLLRTYPFREALENWSPGQDSDVQQKLLTEDTSSSVIEIVEDVVPTSLQKIVHDFDNDDTPEKRSASSYPLLRTYPSREALENWSPGQDSDVQQKLLTEDISSSVREIVEDIVTTSLRKSVHDFQYDSTSEKRSASPSHLLRTYPSREPLENWSPGQDSDVEQKLLTEDTSRIPIREIVEDIITAALQKSLHDFDYDDTVEKRSASSSSHYNSSKRAALDPQPCTSGSLQQDVDQESSIAPRNVVEDRIQQSDVLRLKSSVRKRKRKNKKEKYRKKRKQRMRRRKSSKHAYKSQDRSQEHLSEDGSTTFVSQDISSIENAGHSQDTDSSEQSLPRDADDVETEKLSS